MARRMALAIISASMIALSLAQTFQYSRGWTNGKRGGGTANPSQYLGGLPVDFADSLSGAQQVSSGGNPIVEMPTPCQIKKLKMFLRGTAGADQLYLMPCEILETGSAGPSMQQADPPQSAGRYRRAASSITQDNEKSY